MRRCSKKSSTGTITSVVVVVVAIALVAGLGGYAAYRIFQGTVQTNSIDISGNSLSETVRINSNSTVNVSCNYCSITLQLGASNVRADLNISGNYNHVYIMNGQTNISVSGDYNTIFAQVTTVLGVQNNGVGNTIQR